MLQVIPLRHFEKGDVLSILLGRDGTPKDAKGSKGVYTLC